MKIANVVCVLAESVCVLVNNVTKEKSNTCTVQDRVTCQKDQRMKMEAPSASSAPGQRGIPGQNMKNQHHRGICRIKGSSSGAVDEMLDAENKRLADNLSTKVTRLKSLALDIDREADDHNMYLDGMDSDFMSVTGLLSGSVKRFTGMARSGKDNRKLLCYVSVGLVGLFFLLYFLVSRAST
ncbi:BET1-like protein isoform X1 [Pyxicephalus adspersus]|uniref:BET1-like protein isoform X1 n=1 Tax=Pyxicephalus adspersus TaxID=30357 RepID=UPI003B5C853A